MNKLTNSLLIVAMSGAFTFAAAQTAPPAAQPGGPGVYDAGHPRVNEVDQRLQNQKQRIEQGVKNGTMTKQEARQAWHNDRRIAHQERRAMAADGGHLTKQDQNQLNRELNHNSKKIYREKHN